MEIINCLLGRNANHRRQAEAIANRIVKLYRQGRICGTFRLDYYLYQELCRELPQELAQEVMTRFQRRRARGFPKVEYYLQSDIVMAVHERDCYAHPHSKQPEIRLGEARIQELCHELPQQLSAEVITRFQRRCARGYPKTEYLLKRDIAMARDEGEHYARTFRSIMAVARH